MNNTQIKSFLVAAKHLNFTKAADELFMAQPVLSRQIAALERELDLELFDRNRKKVCLTLEGKILAEGFAKLSEQVDLLLQKAQAAKHGMSGTLRLGIAIGQILGKECTQAIRYIEQSCPRVKLQLFTYTLLGMQEALKNGKIDIALTSQYDTDGLDYLNTQMINRIPNHLVMGREHRLANREHASLQDCREELFLNISPSESASVAKIMNNWCICAGFQPKIYEVPDIGTLPLWLEITESVAILNSECYVNFLPGIKSIPLLEVEPAIRVAAWRKDNKNPVIRTFLSHMGPSLETELT